MMRVSSMSADFQQSVFLRLVPQRKSNLRPTVIRRVLEQAARLGNMSRQSVEFLAHVGFSDLQGDLLRETFLGKRRRAFQQLGELVLEARTHRADLGVSPLRGTPAQALDLADMAVDHLSKRLAFGGARRDQRLQCLLERAGKSLVQRGQRVFVLLALVLLLDNTAHAQQAVGRRRGRAGALRTSSTSPASSASKARLMRSVLA